MSREPCSDVEALLEEIVFSDRPTDLKVDLLEAVIVCNAKKARGDLEGERERLEDEELRKVEQGIADEFDLFKRQTVFSSAVKAAFEFLGRMF